VRSDRHQPRHEPQDDNRRQGACTEHDTQFLRQRVLRSNSSGFA
jgi:hypothetical protein